MTVGLYLILSTVRNELVYFIIFFLCMTTDNIFFGISKYQIKVLNDCKSREKVA